MKFIRHLLRNYPFSVFCIVLIWILSLTPFFPETPFDKVEFADKWVHFIMYGGTCSVIWWEYTRQHQKADYEKLLVLAWLSPILMSCILELMQEYCTTTRNGSWLDLAANAVGATLGAVIGLLILRFYPKR